MANASSLMQPLQPLRTYLRQHHAQLRSTPCLMITSSPPPKATQNDSSVHSFVHRNTQSITSEFNLRAVPVTTASAFPTLESVNEALSLAKRAGLKDCTSHGGRGEGVIMGIGSGPAIDLAKAVSDRIHGSNTDGNLILAPATLGGLWAASSKSPSILLDTKEEMLLPDVASSGGSFNRKDVVITLDPLQNLSVPPLYSVLTPTRQTNVQAALSMAHVAAAVLTIVVDVARNSEKSEVDIEFVEQLTFVASTCASVMNAAATGSKTDDADTNSPANVRAQQELIEAILHLPSLMEKSNFAQSFSETVPQQLANALLPTYFPQSHILTYLACILPGLCGTLESNNMTSPLVGEVAKSILGVGSENDNTLSSWASNIAREAGIPTMASLAFGTPDLNTLSQKLDAYNTLRQTDCGIRRGMSHDDSFILDVLERSLNQ